MTDSSDTTSCSDCRQEHIEQRWIQLLLNWLNSCVHPKSPAIKLNNRSLMEILHKYKQDICDDEIQRALLSAEDPEAFIRYNYPLLRLQYILEEKDYYKKLYIMTAVLLYHCCVSSIDGKVDSDICRHLEKEEQELILKFCERLTDMEVTSNNVDSAIKDACEAIKARKRYRKARKIASPERPLVIGSGESCIPSDAAMKPSTSWTDGGLSKLSSSSLSEMAKKRNIRFNSSITVLPSALTETSSYSDTDYANLRVECDPRLELATELKKYDNTNTQINLEEETEKRDFIMQSTSSDLKRRCHPACACSRCSPSGPCCGDPGNSMDECYADADKKCLAAQSNKFRRIFNWKMYLALVVVVMIAIMIAVLSMVNWKSDSGSEEARMHAKRIKMEARMYHANSYICINNLCQKVYAPTTEKIYLSMSRCILQCMGPQLWPHPIGFTFYSKKIVAMATTRLEYKFQSVPSELVHSYLADAFKLFIGELARLERINVQYKEENDNITKDIYLKRINIQLDVESDSDPRLRVDTDETYNLKIDVINNVVMIRVVSPSFCGVRHGLETLSQLILLDQATGYLITLSNVVIRDAPSYKYRGLMIDTGRNYIPVPDLMRTIDAMSTCKLNTFHWRISDGTSFPLQLLKIPELFEYGGFNRDMVYTQSDVKNLVRRAGIRGIRILIEVAAPGPVGRAWSWLPDVSCPTKNENLTCNNILCARMAMKDSVLDVLQTLYSEIIDLTKVDDIFHLSDSLFSMTNCYYLLEDREGFLEKALERLKLANNGFLPKLPIIWYTRHLTKELEAKSWDRLGVQLTEWQANPSDQFLSRFKVIHSSKWDLSCEVKKQRCNRYRTWQNMYSWKSWRNIDVFTIEGGEAILWTDLVDSGNLDMHLWPRAAAVAERLWSDIAVNGSATPSVYIRLDSHRTWQNMYSWKSWRNIDVFTIEGGEAILWTDLVDSGNLDMHLWPRAAAVAERLWSDIAVNGSATPSVYIRLDSHRWRLLLKSVKVQPVWPVYCTFNPEVCLRQLRAQKK